MKSNRRKILQLGVSAALFPNLAVSQQGPRATLAQKFQASFQATGGTLSQRQGAERALQNACGTMCLLACHNYFHYRDHGIVENFTRSNQSVLDAVTRVFTEEYGQQPTNSAFFQSGVQMKSVALNRWGWSTAKIRSTSVGYNWDGLMDDLGLGRPVIANVRIGSPFYNIEHFVVIYLATSSQVVVYDPWIGGQRVFDRDVFERAWVATKYGLAVQT